MAKAGGGKIKEKNQKQAYIWLLPAVLLLLVFGYYPPVRGIINAFTDYGMGTEVKFIGFDNFVELFRDEQYGIFYISLRNMAIFTIVGIIIGNVMTLLLAELLNNLKSSKLSSFFRFAFILPILVPGIVSILIWTKVIFDPSAEGLANRFIALFGAEPSAWYYASESSMLAMILTGLPWVGGTGFLIYLAGLQGIDSSIYEASKLDGCGVFRRIFVIDLPLMRGQIKYFVIMGVIGGLQGFSMQIVLNQDIRNTGLVVPAFYMYTMAFGKTRFGYAASIGVVIFVIALAITIINNKLLKSSEDY